MSDLDIVQPGLAGHYLRASDERRQVTAAYLSAFPFNNRREVVLPADREEQSRIAAFLQGESHQSILREAFDEVPTGFRGALARSGSMSHPPRFYRLLRHLLNDRRRPDLRAMIQHLEQIDLARLVVACILPPELLHPELVSRIRGQSEARDVATSIRILRSSVIDEAAFADGLRALRRGGNVTPYLESWVLRCKFPPSPIPVSERYCPILNGETLTRKALEYRNCLRAYALDLLEGKASFAEFVVAAGSAIIMLVQRDGEWLVNDVYGHRNGKVDDSVRKQAVDYCRLRGVVERKRSLRKETPFSSLRRLIPGGGWA